MKKRIVQTVTVFSFMAILTACPPVVDPGAGGGSTLEAKPPAHINVAGAKGLFLQTGGTSKHLRAARDVTGGAGAELMRINTDASTGVATWTDTDGNPVDVTINRTQTLAPGYLLIDYLAAGASTVAVADLSTGDLRTVETPPENWARIREKDGVAYFVAGGALLKLDLAGGAESAVTGNDGLYADSFVYISSGGCAYLFHIVDGNLWPNTNNQFWAYPADGSPRVNMTGDPSAFEYAVAMSASSGNSTGGLVEDRATRDVFYVGMGASGIAYTKLAFSETGSISAGSPVQASGGSFNAEYHLGGHYLDNCLFTDDSHIIQLSPDGSGGLRADTNTVPLSQVYGLLGIVFRGGFYVVVCVGKYENGVIYAGGNMPNEGPFLISRFAPSGSTMTVTSPVSVPGITDYDVVGDQIFYTTPDGVYQYNQATGSTTLYAGVGSTIQNVNEAP